MKQSITLAFCHDKDVSTEQREDTIAQILDAANDLSASTGNEEFDSIVVDASIVEAGQAIGNLQLAEEEEYSGSIHTIVEVRMLATLATAVPERIDGAGHMNEVTRSTTLQYLAEVVGGVLLAACIARPGTFHVSNAFAGTRTGIRSFPTLHFHLPSSCRTSAASYGWPPLSVLSVREIHSWMMSVANVKSAWGTGPIGRALAALSHVASTQSRAESALLYLLVGLEALYCRGHGDLQRQMLQKSEILLGPRIAFKKRFASIYSERSRFVHGQADIPFSYRLQRSDKSDQFSSNVQDVSALATAMLVATLQHLATERRNDLEFSYHRDTPENGVG